MCRISNTAFGYFPSPLSQSNILGGNFKRFKKTKANEVERWSIHSSLHGDVSRLLEEADLHFNFHDIDDTKTFINQCDTKIMGKFKCLNDACKNDGWSSKRIPITIRLYQDSKYNARVYHQRCKNCKALSRPILNHTYAERVAYRIKKWNGIEMIPPHYGGESNGPHDSELCEGCKDGHCVIETEG